jgi:hypothetical protein
MRTLSVGILLFFAALALVTACNEGYPQDWCSCISQIGICNLDGACEVETEDGHLLNVKEPMLGAEICGTDWTE